MGGTNNTLYAINAKDGEDLWSYSLGPFGSIFSPVIAKDTVFIKKSYEGGIIHAVDVSTGEQKWLFDDAFGGAGEIGVSNGTVVSSGFRVLGPHRMDGIDAETGDLLWMYANPIGRLRTGVSVWNGLAFAGGVDGLVAIDVTTGEVVWIRHVNVLTIPSIIDGIVYIGPRGRFDIEEDGYLAALDATTGDYVGEGWTFNPPTDSFNLPVTGRCNLIYAVSNGGTLYACPKPIEAFPTAIPHDAEGHWYHHQFYDLSSTPIWWYEPDDAEITSPPTQFAEHVFVGASDGTIHALNAQSGDRRWTFTDATGPFTTAPTVVLDPAGGHSIDTRVVDRTFGHHDKEVNSAGPASGYLALRGFVVLNANHDLIATDLSSEQPVVMGEQIEVIANIYNFGDKTISEPVVRMSTVSDFRSTKFPLKAVDSSGCTSMISKHPVSKEPSSTINDEVHAEVTIERPPLAFEILRFEPREQNRGARVASNHCISRESRSRRWQFCYRSGRRRAGGGK